MQKLWAAEIKNYEEFYAYLEHISGAIENRTSLEQHLLKADETSVFTPGFCGVCQEPTEFLVDWHFAFDLPGGSKRPNLRERLECRRCHLNTRMRGALQFLREQVGTNPGSKIYATEQLSSLFQALKDRYPNSTGSEYLRDGTAKGSHDSRGIRHEDGTDLTFDDASFDVILSFDVLEHIPDYERALREIARCLRPEGSLILTVPFSLHSIEHIERARIVDGEIEHILPPEYHGDILDEGGALCFRHFGWNILEDLKECGFQKSALHFYWSKTLAYMGGMPFLIKAVK